MSEGSGELTFWEHLDELRSVLIRMLLGLVVATVGCFVMKDWLFAAILWPTTEEFPTYQLLGRIAGDLEQISFASEPVIINTELTGQLMAHLMTALLFAIVFACPYMIWQVAAYISPALYSNERRVMRQILISGTLLFYVGVLTSYFVVFPCAYRFLIDYEVSEAIQNMISLTSYIDNLIILCVLMGVLFELPMVAIALCKAGIADAAMMKKYRRHAVVVIVTVAAIITPTTDIFTLLLVCMPIYLLYESSIIAVTVTTRRKREA